MIARKLSFAFLSRLMINALGFVSLYFIAHYMGPKALGIISFALAYVAVFRNLSGLGFGSAHIKRVSEGRDFGKCNGTFFTVRMVLIVIMTVIVLGTILIPRLFQHTHFISKEHETVLYVILVATVFDDISMMFNITFGARKETAKQSMPFLVGKIVSVTVKVVVALTGLGVVLLAGANLISAIVILVCFLYLFRSYPIKKPSKEYFRSYTKFAIPVMFIGFLSSISQNIDKIMIQFFWTTADVGYYSAAQRISIVFTFLIAASTTLIFPTISFYHANNRIKAIRNLSNQAERYLSMILFPIVTFILVFSSHICRVLLGAEFISSAPVLIILSLVILINGTAQPYVQQIGGTDRIRLAAKLSAIIFLSNIVLNCVFIPQRLWGVQLFGLGGFGAALATLISITIGSVLFRFHAYRITASRPNLRTLIHLVAALVMGIVLYIFSSSMPRVLIYHIALLGLAGIVVYILILRIFHEFDRGDFHLFCKILSPAQLKNYAVTEIKSSYLPPTSET